MLAFLLTLLLSLQVGVLLHYVGDTISKTDKRFHEITQLWQSWGFPPNVEVILEKLTIHGNTIHQKLWLFICTYSSRHFQSFQKRMSAGSFKSPGRSWDATCRPDLMHFSVGARTCLTLESMLMEIFFLIYTC